MNDSGVAPRGVEAERRSPSVSVGDLVSRFASEGRELAAVELARGRALVSARGKTGIRTAAWAAGALALGILGLGALAGAAIAGLAAAGLGVGWAAAIAGAALVLLAVLAAVGARGAASRLFAPIPHRGARSRARPGERAEEEAPSRASVEAGAGPRVGGQSRAPEHGRDRPGSEAPEAGRDRQGGDSDVGRARDDGEASERGRERNEGGVAARTGERGSDAAESPRAAHSGGGSR